MSFLNPFLLFAALGIALPILAHLLNRQQVKRTDWAAMQFLNRNLRVRSRRLRLRDLLLLLLRCLALLLLVLAFSRPFGRDGAGGWLDGEARAGVVIALDASFSMEHGPEGASRFDRALDKARVIGESLRPGDPVTLLLAGGANETLVRNMAFDPERFAQLLATAEPVPAPLRLDGLPKRIGTLLDDVEAPQKEAYFITDAQARDWTRASAGFHAAFADLHKKAKVHLVPVPGPDANLAVTELSLVSGVLRKGTIARYRATVRNCGSEPAADVEVRCLVDGVRIDSKNIPMVPAGSSESVSLFVPFHNAGPTRITAEISEDLLATDNARRVVAVVRERVSVLCVDGGDGGAGRLLAAALLARSEGGRDEDYLVRSIPWNALPSENLADQDVILLADVPEITPEQVRRFSRFVREGNGLVWFAGDNVKTSLWNERAAGGASSLLPATLGVPVDVGSESGVGRPLSPEMPSHNVCLPLRSLPEDLFSETLFLRRLEVEPAPTASAVLNLAGSGAPILLEHSLGRGQVFLFTTSAGTSWNNMAQTPVFPMLMQQIVTYLTGREFEQPRLVGDSISLTYVEQPDANDAVFETPSQQWITVPVGEYRDQFVARLEDVREAGFYEARVSVQAPGAPIAVNVDPAESEVRSLSTAELNANLKGTGVLVARSDDELAAAIESNRPARSFWRLFMTAGLILLLAECLFAEWLRGKKSRQGRQAATEPENLSGAQNA